jgi:hypothetical protein
MSQPIIVQVGKRFFVDSIGGILGFPVWWYTRGLKKWSRFAWSWFNSYRAILGVGVWVRNIFVPMYGSYDIGGRVVSFFMRLVMIIVRSFGLVGLAMMLIVIMIAYIFLPVLVVLMIFYHGFGSIV